MRKYFFIFAVLLLVMNACKQEEINPFFQEWDTPFGVPPFDRIKVEHYMPAYLAAMEEHNKEIEAIVSNPEEPGFENTIVALDLSGQMLDKVRSTFSPINSANTNPEMQAVNREISPLLTKHYNNISLNPELFNRVKRVWEKRNELDLTAPQMTLLELTYQDFVRNGANLPEEQKAELRKINERLSELSVKFSDNLLAETNQFKLVIEKEEDLAGLPENVISAAAETAAAEGLEGKWVFTLQKPSMIPFLQYSEKRDLREKLYRGYFMRCNNNNEYDNKEIVKEIINLRVKRARMLGYATHAHYVLERNMAKNPETVFHFMEQVWDAALPVAKEEARAQQEMIDEEGGDFDLASWDWWYYTEKIKKEKFDLNDEMVRPYLVLKNAQQGMFDVATKLYGITFKKRTDIPTYHEEAEVFEVTDKDGSHLGLLYTDWHPRPGKRVGAWTTGFRRAHYRDGKKITPIVSVVGNFSRPAGNKPALLTFEEVETMFHEFGHALHSLFNDVPYPGLGSVPRDFVELPSQIMEHWVTEPQVLEMYAHHYETGKVIPTELVEKIREAGNFNQGFATVEYMAAAILDMEYHTLTEPSLEDVLAFEEQTMNKWGLIDEILPRYRTTYFSHIIGGYSAGYYSYSWSEQLDADAFEAFKETGDIFNQEVAARFREHVLSKGRSEDPAQLYRNFRGKDPSIEALLRNRGFID